MLDPTQQQAEALYYPAQTPDSERREQPYEAPTPVKPQPQSMFNKFFIVEDGVISFSQRNITIISCLVVTSYLLIMGYISCTDGTTTCSLDHFPMISDLGKLHPYDRIFCLVMCFHCHTCLMSNIRAFYKLMDGNVDPKWNHFLYWIAFGGACALPLVGYCDEDAYPIIHPCLATGFFICYVIYSISVCAYLQKAKASFDEAGQKNIETIQFIMNFVYVIVAILIYNKFVGFGIRVVGAFGEWSLTMVLLNFFVFLNLFNDFYDTVHPEGKLVHDGKVIEIVHEEEENKGNQSMSCAPQPYEPADESQMTEAPVVPVNPIFPSEEIEQEPEEQEINSSAEIVKDEEEEPNFTIQAPEEEPCPSKEVSAAGVISPEKNELE